ncbi:hypothetical protein TNCV_3005731 [Trichonephila clavipes]|nr:hypothetical protein TNCV_3005731 [Trichonephila clavipes]
MGTARMLSGKRSDQTYSTYSSTSVVSRQNGKHPENNFKIKTIPEARRQPAIPVAVIFLITHSHGESERIPKTWEQKPEYHVGKLRIPDKWGTELFPSVSGTRSGVKRSGSSLLGWEKMPVRTCARAGSIDGG